MATVVTIIRYGLTAMRVGDRPQGVAGDCNSLAETHAWFDSRVAHHFILPNFRCVELQPKHFVTCTTQAVSMFLYTYFAPCAMNSQYNVVPVHAIGGTSQRAVNGIHKAIKPLTGYRTALIRHFVKCITKLQLKTWKMISIITNANDCAVT